MKNSNNNTAAFFALLRAGLWEQNVRFLQYGKINYEAILNLAEEHAVVGLITAGLERVSDVKVPQKELLQFVGQTLQIEQQNKNMNVFLAGLIDKLREEDVYAILVKGQGIAQCYERPLWRSSGDVDLLLSYDNYYKAKSFLMPLAFSMDEENAKSLHLGMTIEHWVVELHGSLRSCCLPKMDRVIDNVQKDVFYGGNVRSWINCNTMVFLPSPDNDVFLIFSHIVKHFFREGIGLRQVCDWCRLMWTYRDILNSILLETRVRKAGLMTEWRGFAAMAVAYLGMPKEVMPLYNSSNKWHNKAKKIMSFIIMTGNFGHNRDLSYYHNQPKIKQKALSFLRHTSDAIARFVIFPKDSLIVWCRMFIGGIIAAIRGK